jgi:hypothetical protein
MSGSRVSAIAGGEAGSRFNLRALSLLSSSAVEHWPVTLNWYLNLFCYAGRTVRKEFVRIVCMGALVVANLATAPLSQPEASRRPEADPLISPPPSLLQVNPR